MYKDFDAIIIGAGIIGAAIGCELARRGWRTLNVDRLSASGQGSTSSSLAIIRTHYSTREGSALAWEGYHYWAAWKQHVRLAEEANLARFIRTGVLVLKTEENGGLATQIGLSNELEIPYQEWSLEDIGKRFPIWDLHNFGPPVMSSDSRFGQSTDSLIEGGVFFPNAGYCNDPRLATNNLQQAAEAAGAVFFFGCHVTNIRSVDNRVVGITLADGKDIDAPVVVNAAGPHSSKINQLAGIAGNCSISTRALRHESVHLTLPENYGGEKNGIVTFDHNVGSYTRPDLGETIFVGSQGANFENPPTVDPDDFDHNFSESAMEPVYRLAQRIPTLGIPNRLKGIVDLWDVTEDWIPVYDRSDLSGFYLAIGTSGNQFKTAPVVGVLMAELIVACENGHDHDLEPIGAYLEQTGNHIDLGVFSRNREINDNSSFSVLA